MDKNELLKYLICEIDLIMHDKDYRFENEDGTWYSRESCKNLTNEEVFEELKGELRQLAKIEDDFSDLEDKLAESDEYRELLLEEKAGYLDLISGYSDKCKQLKQQLAEKEKEIEVMKQMLVDREETIIVVEKSNKGLILNYNQLKKQLDEMKKKKNYYKKKHKETLELKVDNPNQTAIAELEKTKENMNNLYREHKPIYFDLLLIRNTIDQQINNLRRKVVWKI